MLPNAYVGGIMCLFGVDIMNDWLLESRHLMSASEYTLVWISFGCTMWFTSIQTFGVIEGMVSGTCVAMLFFVYQFAKAQDKWEEVSSRSSVIRPPQERRHLNGMPPGSNRSSNREIFHGFSMVFLSFRSRYNSILATRRQSLMAYFCWLFRASEPWRSRWWRRMPLSTSSPWRASSKLK